MKRLKFYTFIMPGSIPELAKSVKEKKLPGMTYVGSVTQYEREGEFVYEGVTPEFEEKIRRFVEIVAKQGVQKGKVFREEVEIGGKKYIEISHGVSLIDPDDPEFLDLLRDEINTSGFNYRLPGMKEEVHVVFETDEESSEELKKKMEELRKRIRERREEIEK